MESDTLIKRFRLALGMTQKEFAERAGISPVYLCQVETRRYQLGQSAGFRVFDAFREELNGAGITLEDLLRGSEESAA